MRREFSLLPALAKIGELVTLSLDTAEILRQVVAITADIMYVDVCSLYLIDPGDGTLVLKATKGLKDSAVGNVRILPGEGITGRAAKLGRIVAVSDVTRDKRNVYIPITGEEVYHSLLSAPIRLETDVIGVINVQTRTGRVFDRNEKELLKIIAHMVAGLLRNAQLFESVSAANREIEQANRRLIESEKLAALGRLSATLSHELRNPLAGLKGASQLLLRRTKAGGDQHQYVALILEEVERLGRIVDDLIGFARPKQLQYAAIDANGIIEDSLLLHTEDLANRNIVIRKRLSKLPPLRADADKFKQVVVNILLNAMDAMPDGGELLVSSSVSIHERMSREIATFHFKDSGPGIPEDTMGAVFEPFFTTKPDGVGLGLAVCKSIIELHGGTISIQSEQQNASEGGTLITLELPLQEPNG